MKKLLLTTAIAIAFTSTAAFAHHPAAEVVDPDIYAMIDENVSDVHADMEFDDDMGGDGSDMNGDTTDLGSTRSSIASDVGNRGFEPGGDLEDVGAEYAGEIDVEAAMEEREVANTMANTAPSGPANAHR